MDDFMLLRAEDQGLFAFPILLVSIGTQFLLYGLIVASLLGAVVTWMYRTETTGVNLDRIGEASSSPARLWLKGDSPGRRQDYTCATVSRLRWRLHAVIGARRRHRLVFGVRP
jgi:hypothetical protein